MKHFKPFCLLLIIALLCAAVPRNASAVSVPGLYGGSVTGTQMETNTWPAVTNVYMRPYPLSTAAERTYYVYWGQINLPAGTNTFYLACDDWEFLRIGGTVVVPLNMDGTYKFVAPAAGFYDFELRAGYNGGGYGGTFKINGVNNPAEPGDMSLYIHDDGRSAATVCNITGTRDATQYGTVSPPYGSYEFPVDTTTNFYVTIGTDYIYLSDTWRVCPTGYVHYAVSPGAERTVIATGSATSFNFKQTELEDGMYHEICWLWREELRIKVMVDGHGSVSTLEAWGNEDTPPLTLMATPEPGYVFYLWTGDLPEASKTSPEITLDFKQARNIVCSFPKEDFVSGHNAWVGTAGDFRLDNPTNWFNECLPTERDTAVFSNAVAGVYTTQTPFSMRTLKLGGSGGDVTFDLKGNSIYVDHVTQQIPALFTLTNGTFRYCRTSLNAEYTIGAAGLPDCRMLVTDATVDGTLNYSKYIRLHPSCALCFTNGAALNLKSAYCYVYSNAVMSIVDSAISGGNPRPYGEQGSYIFHGLTADTDYFPTFMGESSGSSLAIVDCNVGDMWQQNKHFFVGTGNTLTLSGGSRKEWDHLAYWGTGNNCTFNIRDGAYLWVESTFNAGSNASGTNNVLHIHDATLEFGRATSTDTGVAKGITMRLSGTKPLVYCRVPLCAEYTYQFDVPATTNEVWTTAPFRVIANNINVTNSTLVVNAKELQRNGGGIVPLFTKTTTGNWGSEINFRKVVLPAYAQLLGGEGHRYLSVEVVGPRGTLLILK